MVHTGWHGQYASMGRGVCDATYILLSAGDGHEAVEVVPVQNALGILGRVVGHEAVNEGEGGLRYSHSVERAVDEVGVLRDALLEASRAELPKDLKVVVGRRGIGLKITKLLR